MDTFEYLAVLISIVVGLGLTHVLGAIGRVISRPGEQKLYWVHSLWTLYALVQVVYFWWFELGFRGVAEWTGALYAFVVLYSIALYLLCVVVVPSDPHPDYRAYYFSRRRWILGVLLATAYIDAADSFLKLDMLAEVDATGRSVGILIQLAGATAVITPGFFIKKPWYHGALAIFLLLGVLGGLLSWRVPG